MCLADRARVKPGSPDEESGLESRLRRTEGDRAVDRFCVAWIEEGDEVGLREARCTVRAAVLDRAALYASLACPSIQLRSRLLRVTTRERLVGLAAVVDRVFPFRSVPVWGSIPGAVRALLGEVEKPFLVLAPQAQWYEVGRCGGKRVLEEVQMARLRPEPLPEPDPGLSRLDDPDELRELLGSRLSTAHLEAGPFLGIRDEGGHLLAAGGVQLVTDRVAQIAYMWTREGNRREGLATRVLCGMIRELEAPGRRLVLQVRADNAAAIEFYARRGFRGRARTALFTIDGRVR